MKYNAGDEILVKVTVDRVDAKDTIYPYCISYHDGNGKTINGIWMPEDIIVGLVSNIQEKQEVGIVKKCPCLHEEYGKQVCYGTKEREECSCEGDPNKCNFYLEKRTENKTDITAEKYQKVLRELIKLEFYEYLAMFDWSDYEAPLNKNGCLEAVVERYTPKEVIDIYEEYIDKNVFRPNDVVQYNVSNKQYLVTKIFENKVHMIAVDGETIVISSDGIKKDKWEKVKQNVLIQEFFSKEE